LADSFQELHFKIIDRVNDAPLTNHNLLLWLVSGAIKILLKELGMFQTMFVHGNSAMPERFGEHYLKSSLLEVDGVAYSDIFGLRKGWGCTFRGSQNSSTWFQFCIPTPGIRQKNSAIVEKIFLFCDSSPQAQAIVTKIHLWDGNQLFHTIEPLAIFGPYNARRLENRTMWSLPSSSNELIFGLLMAIHVSFVLEGCITFISAGATFEIG